MKSWHPVSLPAWLNDLNVDVILISGFMNSEIRITSTLRYFCQADRLPCFHFEKPLMTQSLSPVPSASSNLKHTYVFEGNMIVGLYLYRKLDFNRYYSTNIDLQKAVFRFVQRRLWYLSLS